jgi:hypothetical protein
LKESSLILDLKDAFSNPEETSSDVMAPNIDDDVDDGVEDVDVDVDLDIKVEVGLSKNGQRTDSDGSNLIPPLSDSPKLVFPLATLPTTAQVSFDDILHDMF